MSILTKLFVVLLALSSMLLTSAIVVYVNREQNWKAQADQAKAAADAARLDRDTQVAIADANRAVQQEIARTAVEQLEAARAQTASAERQVSEKASALAKVQSELGLVQADQARLTEALKVSQDTQGKQQEAIVEHRKSIDELNRKYADANAHIADLTSSLAVTERERRFFAEQLTKSKDELKQLTQALRDANIDLNKVLAGPTGLAHGAPAINGVVKAVADVDGIPHAVISVGSADAVVKGMEFNVISRDNGGAFLGKIKIDKVEPNEASGLLYGPRVGDVKEGVEVRTHLD